MGAGQTGSPWAIPALDCLQSKLSDDGVRTLPSLGRYASLLEETILTPDEFPTRHLPC